MIACPENNNDSITAHRVHDPSQSRNLKRDPYLSNVAWLERNKYVDYHQRSPYLQHGVMFPVEEEEEEASLDGTEAETYSSFEDSQTMKSSCHPLVHQMPLEMPNFKPAVGCCDASDFLVRCFVARLRAGISLIRHSQARWSRKRSRRTILCIHPDGRSLSWRPAEESKQPSQKQEKSRASSFTGDGQSTNKKRHRRHPKVDLLACVVEVRHAWSPDPLDPRYTGTKTLRQNCAAVDAHKSFALILKNGGTMDFTATSADQCKVLIEGFSALCFRLKAAVLGQEGVCQGEYRPMPEDEGL